MIFDKAYNLENRRDFLNYLRVKLFQDNLKESIKPIKIDKKTIFFDESSCFELGKITLDKEISIFEIKQKSKNDPRITLTRDAFKIMESKGVQNALFVFYSHDSSSWRLSLLTLKKSWGETETSNPKRYSFLLGEGEKTRTPEKYLSKIVTDFKDLVSRFDVEVVRKEFFNDYLTLYIRLYKAITDDSAFTKLLTSQKVEIVSFAKNLLGKIVFLYFIQKKGWLGVERDGKYGVDGDKNFMRTMWDDFASGEKNILEKHDYFYNDYLEWLFFAGLNKDNSDNDDFNEYFNKKVPYLNGGLFKEDYKGWRDNISKISNDIFSNADKNGILDTFDLYNFTIDEDDLYDSDIAIDPEMLGRIFEKMISISPENIDEIVKIYENKKKIEIDKELNKKFGAFYTPREIVHYMTKESLVAYLLNNLKGKKEENEEKVRILFDLKEKFLVTKADITEEIFDKLASIIEEVDLLLKKVKILDPAIGSGAFPMGILHEISTIRYYIYGTFYETFGMNTQDFKNESGKVSMYKIKRDVIQNNIYGVDISAGAIDIARLRFWLSLVVDEETPEPLPNFEFKFVCANTLIPLAEEKGQISMELGGVKELNVETLRKYMLSYYNAKGNKDKEEWKLRIESFLGIGKNLIMDFHNVKSERTKQLETYEPFNANHSAEFFDPSLMMGNGKFDIVIGNPPYIANHDIDSTIKKKYDKLYLTANSHYDILILFYELGINLLKQDGIITYITSNKWLAQKYGLKLRQLIKGLNILQILDFGNNKIFENATVSSEITIIKNSKTINDYKFLIGDFNDKKIDFKDLGLKFYNTKFINENNEYNIIPSLNENLFYIKDKINRNSIKLEKLMYITLGAVIHSESGANTKKEFLKENLEEGLKNYLEGKDILKWYNKKPSLFLKYEPTLHREPRFKELFENSKIVCIRTSNYKNPHRFSIDENSYIADSCIIAIRYNLVSNQINYKSEIIDGLNDKYILSLLNSKLLMWNFFSFYSDGLHFYPRHLKETPIKQISPEAQKPFIEKVDKILEITKQAFYDPKNPPKEQKYLEDEIDKMVYELYGLSEPEVRVVEESLEK